MKNSIRMYGLLLLFIFALGAPQSIGIAQSGITLTATAGFDGYCKGEHWFPVHVIVENNGTDLEGSLQVDVPGNGSSTWSYSQDVSLAGVSRKEVTLNVYPRRGINNVSLIFLVDGEVSASIDLPLTCLDKSDSIFGVVAASPSVYNPLVNISAQSRRTQVAQLTINDISDSAHGLEILSGLIFSDIDTSTLSAAQVNAVRGWVLSGGRLLITGGPGWQKTAAGLSDLLPFTPSGTTNTPHLRGIVDFISNFSRTEHLPLVGAGIISTGSVHPDATVLLQQGGAPLIIRQKVGSGEVIYLTPDPAIEPLRTWSDVEYLYEALFFSNLDLPDWADGFSNWGSAGAAAANVPNLGLPSFFLICFFLGAYIVALGPLNYFVLRRLKRRELAWVTIPALVLVFSLVAIVIGGVLRGNRPVIHHLAVIQSWSGEENAKLDGLLGIFSPDRDTYDLTIPGQFNAHPLPNNQFAASDAFNIKQVDGGIFVPDLRIDVGGIEGLAFDGQIPAPAFSNNITIQSGPNRIFGTISNDSDITLQEAVVLGANNQIHIVGDFSPGEKIEINFPFPPQSVINPYTNAPLTTTSQSDSTLQDILGQQFFQRFGDNDISRRYDLLYAIHGDVQIRGEQLYLVGWGSTVPYEVSLDGTRFRTEQTVLYIIQFTPEIGE